MRKEVIFWGCGNIAKEMYDKYKDEISIVYAISNNPKEISFSPESGKKIQVKRPTSKEKNLEAMIIICSVEYEKIAEQLTLLGYTPFEDFIDHEIAEIIWTNKKVVLLYGFCHLRGIRDCLKNAEYFLKMYIPIYYPDYLFRNFYQQERFQYFIKICSVFVCGMDVSPENHRNNQAILERLKANVKVFRLHAVYFGAYFPQKKRVYNAMNKFAIKIEGYDYTPFSYGDSYLNECIEKRMTLNEIYDSIEYDIIYDREFVLKYVENEWKRLRFQECESDFKILDYIEENYKRERLFRNETHMENKILYQYSKQLLQYLGCKDDIRTVDEPLLNCSQHWIYPCVAEILKLEWDVWSETLDLYTYSGWRKVNMREYIEEYYETCKVIYQLNKKNMLP